MLIPLLDQEGEGVVDGAVVATVNSSWELTVGSSSKEMPTVTEAVTVATR